VFLGAAKGVSILDAMPPGLWPTGNATWSGTLANNQAVPGGGESYTASMLLGLCSMHGWVAYWQRHLERHAGRQPGCTRRR
jgi:hypothetical protein